MTPSVIDIDKARMGRPSKAREELFRAAAIEQRMEARVRNDEAARLAHAIEPDLRRLEMVARAVGAPAALRSVTTIRQAVASHARRAGIELPPAA